MTEYRAYAGVGSRETPEDVLRAMASIAYRLFLGGYTLRSGAAPGADIAFERGVNWGIHGKQVPDGGAPVPKEIFIPWDGFQGRNSRTDPLVFRVHETAYLERAMEMVREHHPAWDHLKETVRKLHSRNCYQVLGRTLDCPVMFVICWTPDGAETSKETSRKTGGTGMAIRIASAHGIPVYNLANDISRQRVADLLEAP